MKQIGVIAIVVLLLNRVAIGDVVLDFNSPVPSTIADNGGQGVGFTTRLPGTGSAIPANDPNMTLASGKLFLTSTQADFNQVPGPTGNNLPNLEAPAVFVSGINSFDLAIKATFENVHLPNGSDQLQVYAGLNEDTILRAGLHQNGVYIFSQNTGTGDINTFTANNSFATGDNIEVILSRTAGIWALSWNNLTTSTSGSLAGFVLPWLNSSPDLYFGVVAANAGTPQSFTAQIDKFSVSIIPEASSFLFVGLGIALILARSRR
jgi:hypothetical protein